MGLARHVACIGNKNACRDLMGNLEGIKITIKT
jgi:hypothetical protein